ncbi:hypothetical protein G5I_06633 [Acromyrmex echinatior]|uniref:Uncharacterized protein n=1 Tax=Acromyrmex echinatior TaxID=103372 RepID=F4WLK6_ACREC|nr:hypothetical protein G5I_06633 [Acromyrmex echinatior]
MRCVNRGDCHVAAVTKARAGGHHRGGGEVVQTVQNQVGFHVLFLSSVPSVGVKNYNNSVIAIVNIRMNVAFEDTTGVILLREHNFRVLASLEIFVVENARENAEVADGDWVCTEGRRYLIALNCKEAEIFILKVFTGKTRLVFFARRQRPALKGLITIRTIDERISEKKSRALDLSET